MRFKVGDVVYCHKDGDTCKVVQAADDEYTLMFLTSGRRDEYKIGKLFSGDGNTIEIMYECNPTFIIDKVLNKYK